MSTITVTCRDSAAGAEQFFVDQYVSVTIDGNSGLEHWARSVRAAMTAAGFGQDTIDDMFLTEAERIQPLGDDYRGDPVFCHPSQLPDLLGPTDEADLCDCHCGQSDCPELLKGTLMGFSMYTHPDKEAETLHADDIAGRAPRTPDAEGA